MAATVETDHSERMTVMLMPDGNDAQQHPLIEPDDPSLRHYTVGDTRFVRGQTLFPQHELISPIETAVIDDGIGGVVVLALSGTLYDDGQDIPSALRNIASALTFDRNNSPMYAKTGIFAETQRELNAALKPLKPALHVQAA